MIAVNRDARGHLHTALNRAELLKDLPLMTSLANLSNDLATMERLARDARQGRYEGTAKG